MMNKKFFIFLLFLGALFLVGSGSNATNGTTGSVCYSCDSCLAAGCPTSYPQDPACAAFIPSACTVSSPTPSPSPAPSPSGDTTPPVLFDVRVENIVGSGAQVKWTTDESADSKVTYGTSPGSYPSFSDSRCDAGGYVKEHCANLTGLAQSRVYYYQAKSSDQSNNQGISSEYSFTSATQTTTTATTTTETITATTTGQDHIKGTVTDQIGKGIQGIEVSAWVPEGFGYAATKTDQTGAYDLVVTPGTWEVNAWPGPSMSVYNPDPPKTVTVQTGVVAIVNFVLSAADAEISGIVVDTAGNILSDVYGFASLSKDTGLGSGLGGQINQGKFSSKVPAGTYQLSVFLSPDSAYTAGASQTVTLVSGEITSVKVVVSKNTSKITGVLKDEAGKAVTGFDAYVFATSETGVWQEALFEKATGVYTLSLAAGTWYMGYEIDSASGFLSLYKVDIQVVVGEGQTLLKDLIVVKAGSTIKGQVTDPTGKGVAYAFVGVSKSGEFADPMVAGTQTDANGFYSMVVPAGSYFVKTFVSPEYGFINPEERSVTIADGETLTVNVQLKTADLAIAGKVFLDNTPVAGAFVWGWSQTGGYQESISQPDGSFLLNITGSDSWTIGAGAEINGVFYKSSEVAFSVLDANVSYDISLVKVGTLPSSVSKTFDASELNVVEVSGGPTVTAPASSLATSGAVSISVSPDTSTPSQGAVKVVGVAYDFEAHDASGNIVSSFTAEVTITMPYEEKDVAVLGASEDELQISFWDEAVGTWKFIDKSVVNKEQNMVTGTVDHFTRFAIVAAADITPPSSPSQVTATALGGGRIQLKWVPPVSDYDHAKIYRSQQAGQLGKTIAVEVAGNEFLDEKDILDTIFYYYTVRAVDGAGNESSNVAQASVQAQGSSGGIALGGQGVVGLPPGQAVKLQILRNLTVGSTGEDVKVLQEKLLEEGVYPAGLITGYFGEFTKQAVIRFQEKYASEILQQFSIASGTGFVGPATRKKINELSE